MILLEGEARWRSAWWPTRPGPPPGEEGWKDENGVPKKVLEILDRWERREGMRVNLKTGGIERLPTSGSAYAGDPAIAGRCR